MFTLNIPGEVFLKYLYPSDADTDEWVSLSLVMAGKFSVSSSNVIMPLYTAELFPTVIRNLGVGTSNIPAGIALIMVPYLWNLVSSNMFFLYPEIFNFRLLNKKVVCLTFKKI